MTTTTDAATNYLELKLLQHVFTSTAYTSPKSSLYLALATAVADAEAGTFTEANFGSYARVKINGENTTQPYWVVANAGGTVTAKNNGDVSFPASSSGTNTVTHVVLMDNGTIGQGNALFIGDVTDRQILSGDIFRVNDDNLTVELK
tara:strand:+ start:5805 stop:6245 length:441 start_codon:yes stop_codon:yes gene_type:complete